MELILFTIWTIICCIACYFKGVDDGHKHLHSKEINSDIINN